MPERPVGGVFARTFAILAWRQLKVGAYAISRTLSEINISVDDTWIEIGKLWDRTDWQLEKAVMAVTGNKEEG